MLRPWERPYTWILLLVVGGCASGSLIQNLTPPDRFSVAQQQLLVHSDFPLPQHHRMLDELLTLRNDISRELALPASDEPIHLYLFESAERFRGFVRLHHPDFPNRRAFFIETDNKLSIYVQWGDRMAEDLRHEVTHAYLHGAIRNLPIWVDEGLAEYHETPRIARGLNLTHVERLNERIRRNAWQPDLRKLERRSDDRELDQDEYAESWAWVHFLLESRGETAELLKAYLTKLRTDVSAEPLSTTLPGVVERSNDALVEHVRSLAVYLRPKSRQPIEPAAQVFTFVGDSNRPGG